MNEAVPVGRYNPSINNEVHLDAIRSVRMKNTGTCAESPMFNSALIVLARLTRAHVGDPEADLQ